MGSRRLALQTIQSLAQRGVNQWSRALWESRFVLRVVNLQLGNGRLHTLVVRLPAWWLLLPSAPDDVLVGRQSLAAQPRMQGEELQQGEETDSSARCEKHQRCRVDPHSFFSQVIRSLQSLPQVAGEESVNCVECQCRLQSQLEGGSGDETEEEAVVPASHAVVQPLAVVVETGHAAVALTAVLAVGLDVCFAYGADLRVASRIKRPLLLVRLPLSDYYRVCRVGQRCDCCEREGQYKERTVQNAHGPPEVLR